MSKLSDKKWCNKQYWTLERSIGDIAKELDTYPNKVRRALKSHGIKIRDKGAAQSAALKSGRSSHPTKNKGHSEAAKIKISESVARKLGKVVRRRARKSKRNVAETMGKYVRRRKVKAKGVCYTGDKKGGYRGF